MSEEKEQIIKIKLGFSDILIRAGVFLSVFSVGLWLVLFYPVISQELLYFINRPNPDSKIVLKSNNVAPGKKAIIPVDTEFGIVIPKINANSSVVANVNWEDPKEYQVALTQGVAHAQGSVFPGQIGNVFLFAHSSADFYQANIYNAVFYLINKLQNGDEFTLIYKGVPYTYTVTDKKIVDADDVEYMESGQDSVKKATLMTCWPAGTNLKRLVVVGVLSSQ